MVSIELKELKLHIQKLLHKGFIRPSVLFVKKNDESICLCIDYQKQNSVTIENKLFVAN